jgi:mannose/fructose/N-acetylgalactosamine-specific phosphotransferase system component IID
MNKIDLLYGFIFGIIAALLGTYLFITFYTDFTFASGLQILKSQGNLGKVITLGAIPSLAVFGILLSLNKEMMARGVVLAVIALAILTIFI